MTKWKWAIWPWDILELADYTVMTASSGEDALAMLIRDEVAVPLVLCDVTLQGMSGMALLAELRNWQGSDRKSRGPQIRLLQRHHEPPRRHRRD